MKKRTILFSLMAVLVSLTMVLAGCADGGTTTKPGKLTDPQELRVNISGEPNLIDVNRASWATEISVIRQVFQGLLGFNQDLSLKAVVATAIPTVENKGILDGGKTYVFKLKKEVTWSDGKKVTAKDFEYSLKRTLDPDVASDYASFYFPIAGAEAYFSAVDKSAAEKATLRTAVGVKATDDATLEIKLAEPNPTFLQLMALWPAFPVRQDIIEKFGEKWANSDEAGVVANYIGNGPFKLVEWVHDDHMTFVPNDKYWGTKPILTKLTFKMITDANAALAAYKNNELDISGVPPGTEKATMADAALSPQILRYNELVTFGLRFNVTKAPFENKLVRQALSTAIDRVAYVNDVRGGVGTPALSWIPPGMPGYDANLGSQYKFDAAKAKQLLKDAGYADGKGLPVIKFSFSDTAGNRTLAQFVQGQMKANLGLDITLDPMESKAFTASVNAKQPALSWYGWGADYPDPDNWLPELFGTNAGNNKSNYSSKPFDDLAKQAKVELNETKRLQLWAQAHKIVVDDAAMAFMFNRERFLLKKPWLKGLKTTGMDGQVAGDGFYTEVFIQK